MKNRIAVITPYYKESLDVLSKCHESVISQATDTDHFFIADGHPRSEIDDWNVKHITLHSGHSDNGNTPRGIGSLLAIKEGYDFIAYLDADNWFHENHLVSLLQLWNKTKAPVCCAMRTFHHLNGEMMRVADNDENEFKFVDTSCYLIHRDAFDCLDIWHKMPSELSPICDRVFYSTILHNRYSIAFSKLRTVAFRTQYKSHYKHLKSNVPNDLKDRVWEAPYQYLRTFKGVRETIEKIGFFPSKI